MNISIIGTGFIASVHAEALLSQGHSISLVVDRDIENAKAFAEKLNIPNYSKTMEDVNNKYIEAVHICTPPALHFSMVKQCLEYNKHVLCEKPLCLTPAEALVLISIAKEKDLNVAVNYNVRFHTLMNDIRKVVQSKDFGDIFLLHGNYLQEFHVLPTAYSWRYQDELGGNMRAVTEIGSHIIDLMPYLTGLDVVEVSANFSYIQNELYLKDNIMYKDPIEGAETIQVQTEDVATVNLRFNNGSIGNFTFSEVSHGRNNHIKFEITGTRKSVWWNSETPYQFHTASQDNGTKTVTNDFGNGFNETIKSLITNFYNSISNPSNTISYSYPTLEDGYKNVIICSALLESSNRNGAWVKINYNEKGV